MKSRSCSSRLSRVAYSCCIWLTRSVFSPFKRLRSAFMAVGERITPAQEAWQPLDSISFFQGKNTKIAVLEAGLGAGAQFIPLKMPITSPLRLLIPAHPPRGSSDPGKGGLGAKGRLSLRAWCRKTCCSLSRINKPQPVYF